MRTVYGPVSQYLMEAEDADSLIEYTFDGQQLAETRIPILPHLLQGSTL
jgi:hypothetical protein